MAFLLNIDLNDVQKVGMNLNVKQTEKGLFSGTLPLKIWIQKFRIKIQAPARA